MKMEQWWCDTDMKIEVLGEKPVSVPLFTPQTQHGLALLELCPALCDERPENNHLSHATRSLLH
jgi:hypothetical protein